jgi:NADH-quinone oxidoreductase subunit N
VGAIAGTQRSIGIIFGMVFLISGIAFKISAVPFHMWTPDVYEGAPTPVTAFFAAAPKVAAMALIIRVVTVPFGGVIHDWQQIVIFLSIASMVLAAFAAIGQNNLKRLLAYSSIGHVGFALVGLSAGTSVGVEGVAVYMAVYIVMTICMFAALLALRTQGGYVETIPQLAGLAQKKPFVAAIIAIVMFSFIGLPPLAGFFAKWQVFLAAIDAHLFALAIIGVLASAVSAFYYLRIIKVMYFDEPQSEFVAVPAELTAVMAVAGFFIVTYFVTVGSPLYNAAHAAAGSLF